MDSCEPGHDWRAEREGARYVQYRCADCGAVCVAPERVEERALAVPSSMSARSAPGREPATAGAPAWTSVAAVSASR